MKVDSKPYGEIDIDPSKTVTVTGGLFGFEEREEFVIIGKEDEQPFEWLQSLEEPSLAFVVTPPQMIRPNYSLSVLEEDLRDIGVESSDEVLSYAIVVVPEDPQEMTVNLKGPIVINPDTLMAKQVINQVDEYGVRHRVMEEIERESGAGIVREGGTA